MDILDVNEYLNAASEALQDNVDYQYWLLALYNARKEAIEECDCYTGKVEGCLWQLYVRQLAYILDNRAIIEDRVDNISIPDDVFEQ